MEIDIAVDLKGYTQGSRTGILARRPVPVQINYLGMPATMGARYIDYIIADPWVIPPGDHPHYAEQILYLPDSYQATDDRRPPANRCSHARPRRSQPPGGGLRLLLLQQ